MKTKNRHKDLKKVFNLSHWTPLIWEKLVKFQMYFIQLHFKVSKHLCANFLGFCPDFRQIKTFGVTSTPPAPTPLLTGLDTPSATPFFTTREEQGTQDRGSCDSTRLVSKQLSDLWMVPTSDRESISGPFTPEELAATRNHLEP